MAVDIPFSEVVAGTTWQRDARDWVRQRAEDAGLRVTGAIEQPRVRPWSTQLVAPTDHDRLWFKANCAASAFEPSLHAVLADLEPEEVDEPVAIEADRGWVLTGTAERPLASDASPPSQTGSGSLPQAHRCSVVWQRTAHGCWRRVCPTARHAPCWRASTA